MTDKQITADLFLISKLLEGENFQVVYNETFDKFSYVYLGECDGGAKVVYD